MYKYSAGCLSSVLVFRRFADYWLYNHSFILAACLKTVCVYPDFSFVLLSINHRSLFFVSCSFQRNDDLCIFGKAKRWPAIRGDEWGACSYRATHRIIQRSLSVPIITFWLCLCVTQGEKIIFEYFSDPEFIDQLIEFLSLEDRKGKDSFNPRRFLLFKVQLSSSIDLTDLIQSSDAA